MSETIAVEDLRRIAELCSLELGDEEAAALKEDLTRILGHVDQLKQVDIEGVAPMSHALPPHMSTEHRPDEPLPSLERAAFLESAPGATDEGFAVPAFVDES